MGSFKINFIIGQLSNQEAEILEEGYPIVSKMILTPDDFQIFHYKEGDAIQVETNNGHRLWCKITDLEVVNKEDGVILIFTLRKEWGVCRFL